MDFAARITALLMCEANSLLFGIEQQIETIRTRLNKDNTLLETMDYGAGPRDHQFSQEEMVAGVSRSLTIAEYVNRSGKQALCEFLSWVILDFGCSNGLELGTCVGISAAYQAAAFCENGGTLHTIEGDPALCKIARSNFIELGLSNVDVITGRFQEVLPSVLEDMEWLDYLYIDGHFDGKATLNNYNLIKKFAVPGTIMIFHDISYNESMKATWQLITQDETTQAHVVIENLDVGIIRMTS